MSSTATTKKKAKGRTVDPLIKLERADAKLAGELKTIIDELPAREAELEDLEDQHDDAMTLHRQLEDRFNTGNFAVEGELVKAEMHAASLQRRLTAVEKMVVDYPARRYPRIKELCRELSTSHAERCEILDAERLPRLEAERQALLDELFSDQMIETMRRLSAIEGGAVLKRETWRNSTDLAPLVRSYLNAAEQLGNSIDSIVQKTEALPPNPHAELMRAATPYGFDKWFSDREARADAAYEKKMVVYRKEYFRRHDHGPETSCMPACMGWNSDPLPMPSR